MNALVTVPPSNVDAYRASTDAAAICKEIVVQTAKPIQGRNYVCVEGWQAIALAHGCVASARAVEAIDGGVRAVGEVRRMSDGFVISEAEGFVGCDEPTWYGGEVQSYGKTKILPKRPDYAIRAMAQTRAISRACRSAFAHVVVMMNAGLQTTPAEEVPSGGFDADIAPTTKAKRGLDGPYTSKAALREAFLALEHDVQRCGDDDTLDALLATDDAKAVIAQCERDMPHYLHGGEPAPPEFDPLFTRIKRMRDEFQLENVP